MFLKAAKVNFRKHIFFNILIILQLSIMIGIIISLAGAVESRLDHYLPVKGFLTSDGYFCSGTFTDKIKEQVHSNLKGVKDVHTIASTGMYTEDGNIDTEFSTYIYDDYVLMLYSPEISEGEWLSADVSYPDDTIPIVISNNGCNYKTGDIIKLSCYLNNSDKMKCFSFYVVGVISDNTDYIFCNNNEMLDRNSADMMYCSFTYNRIDEMINQGLSEEEAQQSLAEEAENLNEMMNYFDDIGVHQTVTANYYNTPIAFMRERDAQKLNIYLSFHTLMITMESGLSDQDEFNNLFSLKNTIQSCDQIITNKQLNKNYMTKIKLQLASTLPVIIISLVLILLSAISIGAITTIQQLKTFGIFYANGSNWISCIWVSIYNSIMICIPSLTLTYVTLFFIKLKYINLTITFSTFENVSALAVVILFILLSMIIPLSLLRRKSPKEIINENN
ncbi:MAG: hypothetical protein ACI4JW_07035 [Oscillospiraceae bacterium]